MPIEKITWALLRLTMGGLGLIGVGFLGASVMVALAGDVGTAIVLALIGFLVGAPPKYDPAVRLKEWMERP